MQIDTKRFSPQSKFKRYSNPLKTYLFVVLALTSCLSPTRESSTPLPIVNSTVNSISITNAIGIASDPIQYFGWIQDGRVFYSVKTSSGLKWYLYNPATNTSIESNDLRSTPEVGLLDILTENGKTETFGVFFSPNREQILYERRPENYQTATPLPRLGPLPPQPLEVWLAKDRGQSRQRLIFNFDGCKLIPETKWRNKESLILTGCNPVEGVRAYFLVDTLNSTFEILLFPKNSESPIFPLQADLSYDGQSLAFRDSRSNLWIIPADKASMAANFTNGLKPSYQIMIPPTNAIFSPLWSSDDQWVYFWESPKYRNDLKQYPLSLKRVNAKSKVVETVLSETALKTLMGAEAYGSLTFSDAIAPDWNLSPDGSQVLLRLGIGTTAPPTKYSLWLISLGK